jgi:hypothetical protein
VPPPPPPPPKKGRDVAVVVAAVAAGILVVGSLVWLVSGASGDPQPPEEAVELDAGRSTIVVPSASAVPSPSSAPSPNSVSSPDPVIDTDRISAIITDAHSGRYFANKFQHTYPKLMEVGMVEGMIESANADPTMTDVMTDAFFACSLSYVETHWSFMYVAKHPNAVGSEKVGVKIGFACLEYMNL